MFSLLKPRVAATPINEAHQVSCQNILNIHMNAGRYDDALDFATQVLEIQRKQHPKNPDHPDVLHALANTMRAQIPSGDQSAVANTDVERLERAVYGSPSRFANHNAYLAIALLEHLGHTPKTRGSEREERALREVADILEAKSVVNELHRLGLQVCLNACVNLTMSDRHNCSDLAPLINGCCKELADGSPALTAYYYSIYLRRCENFVNADRVLNAALADIDQQISDGIETEQVKFWLLESQLHTSYELGEVDRSEKLTIDLMILLKDRDQFDSLKNTCRAHLAQIYAA